MKRKKYLDIERKLDLLKKQQINSPNEISKFNQFSFPIAKKISAQTIGLNLSSMAWPSCIRSISVSPISGDQNKELLKKIKGEVNKANRDNRIDHLIEDKDLKEMKLEDHPDYPKTNFSNLFYMDYQYGSNIGLTGSSITGPQN